MSIDLPSRPADVPLTPPPPRPAPTRRPRLCFAVGGVQLFEPLDIIAWVFVLVFFSGSSLLRGGHLPPSLLGALEIVVIMFFVGASIEVIIEALRNVRGLGTLVGFITNGPEALCLVVGLIAGDILFAASTPLGSNFMNPVMLLLAAACTGCFRETLRTHPGYTVVCIVLTASLACGFFFIPAAWYPAWMALALLVTVVLFRRRPPEPSVGEEGGDDGGLGRIWFLPAFAVLVGAGYLLDPAVSFAAAHAHAPKGVIGFFVLSTLTSWPEFKSCLALNRRRRCLGSVLNITVSNITNIWLAWLGVAVYLLAR
jgi:cation:H+ antiporter